MTETTGLTGMGRAQIAGNLVLFPKFGVLDHSPQFPQAKAAILAGAAIARFSPRK